MFVTPKMTNRNNSIEIRNLQTKSYYTSNVLEEIDGRPMPGIPIKIMGQNPRIVGGQVAKLVRARFRELRPETIESMPRARMISLQLKSSYLMISFTFPPDGPRIKKQSVIFSRFVKGFMDEICTRPLPNNIAGKQRREPFWFS